MPEENSGAFKIKKVDFFWINRDQHSFEWFLKLMTQLEVDARDISVGKRVLIKTEVQLIAYFETK